MSNLDITPGTLLLVASPLLFYGVKKLLQLLPTNCLLIFAEAVPELLKLSEERFLPSIRAEKGVYSKIIGDVGQLNGLIEQLPVHSLRSVKLMSLSGGYALASDIYREWEKMLAVHLMEYWRNRATLNQLGPLWIKNLFRNLIHLEGSIPIDSFRTEKPIFVAGAGESLEGSLQFLKGNRKSLFILSVDTAAQTLLQAGIRPDLLVVMEGQYSNIYDFFHPDVLAIPCLFDLISYPGVIMRHRSRRAFFLSRFARVNLIQQLAAERLLPHLIPPLGSVGVGALQIALQLTNSTILFSGLDFCFRPGKTHSRGTPTHSATLTRHDRINSLLDLSPQTLQHSSRHVNRSGEHTLSLPNLLSYRELLAQFHGTGRIWDIGDRSLSSPFARESDLESLIKKDAIDLTTVELDTTPRQSKQITSSCILHFLNRIEKDLTTLQSLGYRYLSGEHSEELAEELQRIIVSHDFLYVSFPDSMDPDKLLEESFLKRVLLHSSRYRDSIRIAKATK